MPGPASGARGGQRGPSGPANVPLPRDDNRHKTFVEIARGAPIELLFVGDSITDGWRKAGQPMWDQHFAPYKPANFGIGGDTTQGVLWRMQNGELDGYKAKLIVLMLGTNNINRNPNDEIVDGDRLIVEEFRKRQPQAKVLILGIFPRAAGHRSLIARRSRTSTASSRSWRTTSRCSSWISATSSSLRRNAHAGDHARRASSEPEGVTRSGPMRFRHA